MADTKISNLPALVTPNNSDVLPIVNSNTTKKITVANLLASASTLQLPTTRMINSGNTGQSAFYGGGGDTTNSTNYCLYLTTKDYETDNTVIEGNLSNMNIQVKSIGRYEVRGCASFYNLTNASGFVRLRLYGSSSPISPGFAGTYSGGGTLLSTLDQGYPGTTGAGEAGKRGSVIINVTSVPYNLLLVFLHGGGTGAPFGNGAFLSGDNTTGMQPEFIVRKLTN